MKRWGIGVGVGASTDMEGGADLQRCSTAFTSTEWHNLARFERIREIWGDAVEFTDVLSSVPHLYHYRARGTLPGHPPTDWAAIMSARPEPLDEHE